MILIICVFAVDLTSSSSDSPVDDLDRGRCVSSPQHLLYSVSVCMVTWGEEHVNTVEQHQCVNHVHV